MPDRERDGTLFRSRAATGFASISHQLFYEGLMTSEHEMNRRRFIMESTCLTCGCAAAFVAGTHQFDLLPQASAQSRRSRGKDNPLATEPAFCGLFCGACSGLQESVRSGTVKCYGCRSNQVVGHCKTCKVRECAKSKQVHTCGLCESYPCDKIKEYHNDETEESNKKMAVARKVSEDFQYFGNDPDWVEKQIERWSCKKCGTVFEYGNVKCPKCSAPIITAAMEAAVYARRKTPVFTDFDGRSWQTNLAYATETKTLGGRKALLLQGSERTIVFLSPSNFRNGTIECDIAVRNSGGLAFRAAEDGSAAELVQLRFLNTKADKNKKLILYSPHGDWRSSWRELRSKEPGKYDVETKMAKDKWFRLKLVVAGKKLDVYLDKDTEPVLTVAEMLGKRDAGCVGLYGENARFANFTMQPES
ncbi:MAG TPA: hypothetical protein DEB39_05570 [Planctomycetaceae bacterium]|nr:hypothetical protein [Planctomycetaceae bacterium]